MDMFALEQRLATLEKKLVEAQRNRQSSEAQLSKQDRYLGQFYTQLVFCSCGGS